MSHRISLPTIMLSMGIMCVLLLLSACAAPQVGTKTISVTLPKDSASVSYTSTITSTAPCLEGPTCALSGIDLQDRRTITLSATPAEMPTLGDQETTTLSSAQFQVVGSFPCNPAGDCPWPWMQKANITISYQVDGESGQQLQDTYEILLPDPVQCDNSNPCIISVDIGDVTYNIDAVEQGLFVCPPDCEPHRVPTQTQ